MRWSSYEADRLSQLAEDLLLIARADRGGQLPLRREPIDVSRLFATVASRFEWCAAELGKTVQSTTPDELVVEADPMRLEQALGNLVDNALRYGGDEVTLAATQIDGRVELHVRDDGQGFPSDFLSHAFDRFARVDAARGGGGSGLGLAIVKTIAESHQGTAQVVNGEPSGADAWISLPVSPVFGLSGSG